MDCLFELLFLFWCKAYDPERFPKLRDYAVYSFREGLQLGLCLGTAALGAWTD